MSTIRRDQTPSALRLPGMERETTTALDFADRDRREANPTRWRARETNRPAFDGDGYNPEFDYERLSRQLRAVYEVMKDGRRRTIREVVEAVGGGSETGIAAAMRALRQKRNGGHRIEKERRGDPRKGVWHYWMVF